MRAMVPSGWMLGACNIWGILESIFVTGQSFQAKILALVLCADNRSAQCVICEALLKSTV